MTENLGEDKAKVGVGLLADTVRQIRLIWRLLRDARVPLWVKMIVPATIFYVVFPIDILPDPILGLGQLDDLAVIILGSRLFVEMCPRHVVEEHLNRIASLAVAHRPVGMRKLGAEEGERSKEV